MSIAPTLGFYNSRFPIPVSRPQAIQLSTKSQLTRVHKIGGVFSTLGIASLFMPAIMGIIADRWINAEKLYGMCHLIGAALLFWSSTVTDPNIFFWAMLLNSMFYMPTIALNNTVSYTILEQKGFNIVKDFPPIRVWGTIGFIAAMWTVDICGWKSNNMQLIFSAVSAIILGVYAMTMPTCPPSKSQKDGSFLSSMGLDAFVLFKQTKMSIFFLFAMFLGVSLIDMPDVAPAIVEMTRVLKPRGRLLIANLNVFNTAGQETDWSLDEHGKRKHFQIDHYLTESAAWIEWRGIRIRNHHRPLSTYRKLLLAQVLTLTYFDEPRPASDAPAGRAADYVRAPWFMVMEWAK